MSPFARRFRSLLLSHPAVVPFYFGKFLHDQADNAEREDAAEEEVYRGVVEEPHRIVPDW